MPPVLAQRSRSRSSASGRGFSEKLPSGACCAALVGLTPEGVGFCNRRGAAASPAPAHRLLRLLTSGTVGHHCRIARVKQQPPGRPAALRRLVLSERVPAPLWTAPAKGEWSGRRTGSEQGRSAKCWRCDSARGPVFRAKFGECQAGSVRIRGPTCGSSTHPSPNSTHNYPRRSPTNIPSPAPGARSTMPSINESSRPLSRPEEMTAP